MDVLDPLQQILATCPLAASKNNIHVHIDDEGVNRLALRLSSDIGKLRENVAWDSYDWHYSIDSKVFGPLTCQYIFVMDALNFCFWPTDNLEYDYLATSLKRVLTSNPEAFNASSLVAMTEDILQAWLPAYPIPLISQRVNRLKELGAALLTHFNGMAANMVIAANHSCTALVQLILMHIPGFRDTSVYKGQLIHLYKRVQILVADVWAAYGKERLDTSNPYCFHDIEKLTMFADYRIPQLLRHLGVLVYSKDLCERIDTKTEICFGSLEEIEIRATTVVAVEQLKDKLNAILKIKAPMVDPLLSIELDWLLWNEGEKMKENIPPHHRTLTIYY